MVKFRHEYKFPLSQADYLGVRMRLRAALTSDAHVRHDGEYAIRSIYFDNLQDKALREKIDGVNCREKFRIRYYNGDLSFLSLEKKSKINGLCNKVSAPLTAEEADCLFHGDLAWMEQGDRPLVSELYSKMKLQQLRPKTVVDYRREPFLFSAGNVRVTLDRDIRTAPFFSELLHRPVCTLPTGGAVLLEVKYDAFLPEVVRSIVQLGDRQSSAFSKYAICRIYG